MPRSSPRQTATQRGVVYVLPETLAAQTPFKGDKVSPGAP